MLFYPRKRFRHIGPT